MTNEIANKIFEEHRKKISYDINSETLEMIDEFAKVVHGTRAQILDMVIFPGIISQIETMEKTWKDWFKSNEHPSKEKKEKLKEAIGNMENFKKKWGLDKFPKLVKEYTDKTKEMNSKKR
jgi:hypothetical protein